MRFSLAALVLCAACPTAAAAQSDLDRARIFYNGGNLEGAIEAATAVRVKPPLAASAALIVARARLERFRQSGDPADLNGARKELATLNPFGLSRREMTEWQIGLALALYFENELGAASEWFKTLLVSSREHFTTADAEKLLEWWATSTGRFAEMLSGAERVEKYREMLSTLERELEREPGSQAATYWSIVASRGTGDLSRAWSLAVAAWIRASGIAGTDRLRTDLERLVLHTLIPERAQQRSGQRLDTKATAAEVASLTEEWRSITRRWSGEG
jgi:hypothetical protein